MIDTRNIFLIVLAFFTQMNGAALRDSDHHACAGVLMRAHQNRIADVAAAMAAALADVAVAPSIETQTEAIAARSVATQTEAVIACCVGVQAEALAIARLVSASSLADLPVSTPTVRDQPSDEWVVGEPVDGQGWERSGPVCPTCGHVYNIFQGCVASPQSSCFAPEKMIMGQCTYVGRSLIQRVLKRATPQQLATVKYL